MKIQVVEYSTDWGDIFKDIKYELVGILDSLDPVIEHFGSTSVKGLAAKPVIDIAVGLKIRDDLDRTVAPMIAHDYIYYEVFNADMPERRLYVKLKKDSNLADFKRKYTESDVLPHEQINDQRLAHVHIWIYGSTEWRRHIAFRDYLRSHAAVKAEYAELKKALSKKSWKHGMAYNDGKNDFVQRVQTEAVAWYNEQQG